MTTASPWSVKGIDPKARELAKDLARRSGMTLGEWLNQMIIEGDADGADDDAPEDVGFDPERREARAPSERASYDRPVAARGGAEPEVRRIAKALEALTQRLESAEHRSTLAISGIDQSVMGVLSRIDAVERDRSAVAARFEGELEDVRASQLRVSDRLRKLSDDDGPRVEAMRALEGAIGKIAEKVYDADAKARAVLNEAREDVSHAVRRIDRLEARVDGEPDPALLQALVGRVADQVSDHVSARVTATLAERLSEAEARTSAAIRALEGSFSGLDKRLGAMEGEDVPGRLEGLARDLAAKVEAQRAELADRLARLADTRVDGVESSLNDLAARVGAVESQSAQAIDRMGREVMRIAQTLGERVASVEARSAEATQQIGGEMARIAQAMESRMARSDQSQAEALERLGGEISRIADRLADRIAHAERRSAEAVDEVSSELGRAAEQIAARHEAGHSALAERIRASEQRTAQLLDEARSAIDRRLLDVQHWPSLDASGVSGAAPVAGAPSAVTVGAAPSFGGPSARPAPDRLTWPDETASAGDPFLPSDLGAATLHASPEAAADPFTGFQDTFAADGDAAEIFAPARPAVVEATSTRDVVAQARAAARAAAEKTDRRSRDGRLEPLPGAATEIASSRFSFGIPGRKKRKDEGVRTLLTASGTAATLAMTAIGATLYLGAEGGKGDQVDRSSPPPTAARAEPKPPQEPAAPTPELKPDSYAAMALAPATTPAASPAAAPETLAAAQSATPAAAPVIKPVEAQALYNAAVGRLSAGDASGVDDLKKAANLGLPAAQFYLSKLYESGGSGLKKDLTEARRWIERAAQGGDAQAMHNLAIYALNGEGGPRNAEMAVLWFTRAANRGLVDSQFNLGRLYEVGGYGVPQNKVEAYKWYLLAAAGADHDARTAADALKAQLPPDQARAAERSAVAFRPTKSDRVAS